MKGLKQWIKEGKISHDTSQVKGFDAAKLPEAEKKLGIALAKELKSKKAIMRSLRRGLHGDV